ncbi:Maf family protein [Candidatus Ichthyocystis hellenicum]|uniref:Maf family protein n=1 Tax=Candidatus Ichthyocystis hellenicum TaxID=1561003 RepID=UPI000B8662A7|nr:Maf family protein [Candidatus Ichthyocystis hellenicum]
MDPHIVLASSSRYRAQILKHLEIKFAIDPPHINETPLSNENPVDLCERLSYEKAYKIAQNHPSAYVIGSDQAAYCDGWHLPKPENFETAVKYLKHTQGKAINFFTGVCLYHAGKNVCLKTSTLTTAYVKELSAEAIESYVLTDTPYDCAGGIRMEKKGIYLLNKLETSDPTAVLGIPLISLIKFLEQCGALTFPCKSALETI